MVRCVLWSFTIFTFCICPYISRTDTGQSIFFHSSGEILMSECLKHSMVISGESSSANMKPSWSSTNCLSPSSSLQDISQVYISPPGCFCGYGFCTIHGFPVVQVRHTPTGLFLHRSKPPHFHVLRNAPVLETAGSPCIEPYITGLYQHAVAAMHIVFDALLIPGHEWDTGEIPEHNVISIHGIYEERQGTFTVSGNKKQTVTCMGIPVGTCLFDMFHHRVHFLYVFPDKPVYPVTPVVQTDEYFLAILLFCLNHDLFYFMVKHAQLW